MATYTIDPLHSEVLFKVKHLMISTVTGSFGKYNGTITAENEDLSDAKFAFEAEIDSISTNNEQRDGHLKSPDFFDSEKHPHLSFKSTKVEKKSDSDYVLHGNLTIKDVTKPVSLSVEFGGIGKDPWGNTKAGFNVEGKINRKDFGLNWNAALETGGVLVSEEVKLSASIQLAKQA